MAGGGGFCRARAAARRPAVGRAKACAGAVRSRPKTLPRPRPKASAAACALCDDDTPRVEPGVLVPVGIIDQRVPFGTPVLTGVVGDKRAVGLGDRGIDGGEDVGEPVVGWGHLTRLGRVRLIVPVVDAER